MILITKKVLPVRKPVDVQATSMYVNIRWN